jgi:hypothetical protein
LLQYVSAYRGNGDTLIIANMPKAIMAGGFQSKRQRAAKKQAARELATVAEVPIASSPSAGVGRRERGMRLAHTSGGGINSSPRADHVRARVRETTTSMQNMQTQVMQLRKKVASLEKSKRYWRGIGSNQNVTEEKDMRSQLSAADRKPSMQLLSVERFGRKCRD